MSDKTPEQIEAEKEVILSAVKEYIIEEAKEKVLEYPRWRGTVCRRTFIVFFSLAVMVTYLIVKNGLDIRLFTFWQYLWWLGPCWISGSAFARWMHWRKVVRETKFDIKFEG
jgi:hypothetical protein